jgi:hypothetical protein
MEVTETLTAKVGENVSALYLLLYLYLSVVWRMSMLNYYQLTHIQTHTLSHIPCWSQFVFTKVQQSVQEHQNTETLKHWNT